MKPIYRPSVCHQTVDEHLHYNIVLVRPPSPDSSNEDLLRRIANRVGGQTAGQVVLLLLEKRELGFDMTLYDVDYIKTERIPKHQTCHKGEIGSPAVDWGTYLFVPFQEPPPRPPANPKIGRIRHT